MIFLPALNSTGISLLLVVLISGPLVSTRIAIFSETSRVFFTMRPMPSKSICAVLQRTTFMPALYKLLINSTSHLISETVVTIFVDFFIYLLLYDICYDYLFRLSHFLILNDSIASLYDSRPKPAMEPTQTGDRNEWWRNSSRLKTLLM